MDNKEKSFEPKELLFHEFVNVMSITHPNDPAITYDGQTISYQDLKVMSDRCSAVLLRKGVKKGDKVAVWSYNSISWVVSVLGIVGAGAVATLLNYGLKADDETALLKSVDASWLVLGPNSVSLESEENAVEAVVKADIPEERIIRISDLWDDCNNMELTADDLAVLFDVRREMNPHDTQVIIFTTGTSSFPKAAQLSSYSILNDAFGFSAVAFGGKKAQTDGFLIALPLFHSYGLHILFVVLSNGNHAYLTSDFKLDTIINMIYENKIKDVSSVNTIYGRMMEHPDFESKIAGKLVHCFVGGAFLAKSLLKYQESAFRGAKFITGYGQTECSPGVCTCVEDDPLEVRATRVGRPFPGLDVRIWNEKDGFLPQGEEGEIVLKGYCVMNGYYGLPKESQAIDEDGWLHTQDLGRIDENGYIQITGRIKDIIIRCGENISPSEIEMVLLEDQNLSLAKVMGAPHKTWGESVEACVVVKDASLFDAEATKERLKSRLSKFKVPSHFFVYSEFPLNSNGKVDQRGLKEDMIKRLKALSMEETLASGVQVLNLSLKEKLYKIHLVRDLIFGLLKNFEFDDEMCEKMLHEIDEVLKQKYMDLENIGGNVQLEVFLMSEILRVRFSNGYSLNEADEQCLDYKYSSDFDIVGFLMEN